MNTVNWMLLNTEGRQNFLIISHIDSLAFSPTALKLEMESLPAILHNKQVIAVTTPLQGILLARFYIQISPKDHGISNRSLRLVINLEPSLHAIFWSCDRR